MNPGPRAALALALLAAACSHAAEPVAIAPTLAPASQWPAGTVPASIRLDRKFDDALPVHLHGDPVGRTVSVANCAQYETLRTRVDGSDNELDYAVVRNQGATCDALALLQRARAAAHSALPSGEFLAWRAAGQFPGSLWAAFSDDEARRLAAADATLQTASGKAAFKSVPDHFLELEGRGAGVHLTLMGLGDIDHDGWQDAVVLVEGYALGGSATTARAAVLTRRTGEARLREIAVDGLLK
jgi:hypothetical protein